jgi:hypothetical protein
LGEQIGGALLAAGKLAPTLILTDHAAFGHLRANLAMPLVLASPANAGSESGCFANDIGASSHRADGTASSDVSWGTPFIMGDSWLQLPVGYETEHEKVIELVELLRARVELLEPFARIHEAVREAQRIGSRSSESHGQAA